MDFQIPEWDNEAFSYHYASSLDQTVIDTAISNAGHKVKKHKKKKKAVDNTFSPNKKQKLIQDDCETTKSSIDIAQSPKDEIVVKEKSKLRKKQRLKTDSINNLDIQKTNSSPDDSNEFQHFNSEANGNVSVDKSLPSKKGKNKKNKKSGKHNKYKELNEKQNIERNKLITAIDKVEHIPTVKKSNSTMEWTVSSAIDSENKRQICDLTDKDSFKSNFRSEEGTNENKKNRKKKRLEKESLIDLNNKEADEIMGSETVDIVVGTETVDIVNQAISRKPIVNNENNSDKNQDETKIVKKKKKKNKRKVGNCEHEINQEKFEVKGSISDISKNQQKIKEKTKDVHNIELNELAKETDSNINKTKKKRKKLEHKISEEGHKKNKKSKLMKVSYENDLEIIEDKNEIIEDSDLKAELERYLRKLKSMKKDELFADDDSENEETVNDTENESDDECEPLGEDDEPGDDLDDSDDSGDVEEETGDNMKESNDGDDDDDDISRETDGQQMNIQEINDVKCEQASRNNLDDIEDGNDSDDDDDDDDENEDEDNDEDDVDADDVDADDVDDDDDDDGNEIVMDDSESEEEAKDEIDSDDESNNDTKITSLVVKNKDNKKKKFDTEKLSALLQESEPLKISPKKLTPAEALRQKMSLQLNSARFRLINEQLYTSTGDDAKKMFSNDPEAFQVYHEGYKSQVTKWPINPLDLIIKWLNTKPAELVVADFGCGEAKLCQSVPQKKVFSLDLQSACEGVIVCDMAHTPLKTASVDIAVFCLSLMGTNIKDYVCEANRVLKQEGTLKIAEVESRFTGDINTFTKVLEKYGFKCIAKDTSHTFFFIFEFKKTWVPKKSLSLPDISLKPCVYKKR